MDTTERMDDARAVRSITGCNTKCKETVHGMLGQVGQVPPPTTSIIKFYHLLPPILITITLGVTIYPICSNKEKVK